MSKGGVIVLIVAALVFCGLGFVIGQVVQASGSLPGSDADPIITQSYVDQLVGKRVTELQEQIDSIESALYAKGIDISAASSQSGETPAEGGETGGSQTNPSTPSDTTQHVKITGDSVNVRASASTSADVVGTAAGGEELVYLGSSSDGSYTWYNVQLSGGASGYVRSDLASAPY